MPAESLAGLTPETTQEFVRKVQPLLMNRCGNANCHGSAGKSDFRLLPVRLGASGHRIYSERNLSAVLALVNPGQPGQSPLLIEPLRPHGGQTEAILTGPRSEEQVELLRIWVAAAARDLSQQQTTPVPGAVVEASHETLPMADPCDSLLQKVLSEEREDRFDPGIFNRMMHPAGP